MPGRRASRFLIEVLFLVALAAAITVAELRAVAIAGVMLLGWLLVAGVEWAVWRDEPHYGSGLPPRWYVPRVDLPPARPLESVVAGYPHGRRDEAPTWIAPAALREQVLGDWPVAAPIEPEEPGAGEDEDAAVAAVEEAWTVVALPPPAPESEPESEPAAAVEAPPPAPEAAPAVVQPPAPPRRPRAMARYSLDPLAEEPKRRFGRGPSLGPPFVEVPARPDHGRPLPGAASREA
ncbi:MAG TPA: hypothetical protein VHC45_00725 [Gaiellaceae bacterium]|nr:hypothetical protein [Gaiellaceae bacterium]